VTTVFCHFFVIIYSVNVAQPTVRVLGGLSVASDDTSQKKIMTLYLYCLDPVWRQTVKKFNFKYW